MEHLLHKEVLADLRRILVWDSHQSTPVIQSISLFFWQNVQKWVRQIAVVPEPFIIALTGPSGSGKSYVRECIVNILSQSTDVSSFTQDNYYRDFDADFPDLSLETFYDVINFDDPAHIRFDKMLEDLQQLKLVNYGESVVIPKLRFGTPVSKPTLDPEGLAIPVSPFIVTEGIHAFYDHTLLKHYDFKIYVDIEEKTRRERWLERNRQENRGTTDNMWNTTVECLEQFILPSREVADLVINNEAPRENVKHLVEEVVQVLKKTAERIGEVA